MKRIEFLAPVEAIRGNLSGRQDLQYAENDNPAFEAPDNKKNYARNYKPRFIGAKISASGKLYYQVKTKSCSHKTLAYRRQMSVMGGAGAIYASILRQKSSTLFATLETAYAKLPVMIRKPSFRKWIMNNLMDVLVAKSQAWTATISGTSITINNPWVSNSQTSGAEITNDVIGKFFLDLAANAIAFKVNDKQGVGLVSEPFEDLIGSDHNVLGLTSKEVSGVQYVMLNGEYLKDGDTYVTESVIPVNGKVYTTTPITPTA